MPHGGHLSRRVRQLSEEIKEKGRKSSADLPTLLDEAGTIAHDHTQDALTRALAHRAAANAEFLLNNFEPALDHYNRAVAILERLDDPTELARTLHAKVGVLYLLTRFDELFECSSRARSIFERLGDRGRIARLDVNLAHAYHRLDRHSEALACCERALPVLEQIGDGEGLLAALINTGVVLTILHEFERATDMYKRALVLSQSQGQTPWARLSKYNLAYMQYLNGEAGEALRQLTHLRPEYEEAGDERHTCLCWLDEAEILLEIGDLEECISSARHARQLAQKLCLNLEIGKALLFEAAASKRQGQTAEVHPLLAEAKQRFESETNSVWTAVLKLQTVLLAEKENDPELLTDAREARKILYKSGLAHHQAFADVVVGRLERSSGDTEHAVGSFQNAVIHADNSRSSWMQFHAYYQLGVSISPKDAVAGRSLLQKAEAMLDSLWQRLGYDNLKFAFLADRESVYTHLVAQTISDSPSAAFMLSEKARSRVLRETLVQGGLDLSLGAIQKRLSADETVLEYFVAGDDVIAFAVNNDSIHTTRLGNPDEIHREWIHLERHLASCSVKWERLEAVRSQLLATARGHLQSIYGRLIAPLEANLRSSIIVVPHGFLHGIPFHALYDGSSFMGDRHQIAYSPSAALYCAPAHAVESARPIFIAFSRESEISTIREIESAAARFSNSEVLVNPSIEMLRKAFEYPRQLVHIAGHAGLDAVGGKLSWIETPEGRLSSRDLQTMQIRASTIVVTGCQTARRHICPGDEWLGLMRAFYLSGASTIVSAFWDVRAECAARFAVEFYAHFDGANASQAVRSASAAIREERSHPYFWAGFGSFVRRRSHHVRLNS